MKTTFDTKISDEEFEKLIYNDDYDYIKYLYFIINQIKQHSFFHKIKLLRNTLFNTKSEIGFDNFVNYSEVKFSLNVDYITPLINSEEKISNRLKTFYKIIKFSNSKKAKIIDKVFKRRTILNNL